MLKIKKLYPDSQIPEKRHEDVGWDCFVHSVYSNDGYVGYKLGIAVEPPEGTYLQLVARSSISKVPFVLCNGVGIIDRGYRGEIEMRFRPVCGVWISQNGGFTVYNDTRAKLFKPGDKIGQLIVTPFVQSELSVVEDLGESERGINGFGSTDPDVKGINPHPV